jgi:hypothetical protein
MNNTLSVKVTNRKTDQGEFFEGIVSISGLKPTKLARKSDGNTQFPTKSALSSAAKNLAKSLGFSGVEVADPKQELKKASKKQIKKSVEKTPSENCSNA